MKRGAVLILLAVLTAAGCSAAHPLNPAKPSATITGSAAGPGGTQAAAGSCPSSIAPRSLPAWARAGFTPSTVAMPYVMGARGDIVAILWSDRDPLHSPQLAHQSNKILWVSRVTLQLPAPLWIRATLDGTSQTAIRVVDGGPGPSIINLPAAGCWSVDLSWSGHHDHLSLRYVTA